MKVWLLHVRIVVRSDNLAQASLSRPGHFERGNVPLRRGDLA